MKTLNEINIEDFCGTEKYKQPFNGFLYTYASDGIIAIRVPKIEGYDVNLKFSEILNKYISKHAFYRNTEIENAKPLKGSNLIQIHNQRFRAIAFDKLTTLINPERISIHPFLSKPALIFGLDYVAMIKPIQEDFRI